jgi:hypothetical protein
MKHLIIGAGATLGEALALGNASEVCPPAHSRFCAKDLVKLHAASDPRGLST